MRMRGRSLIVLTMVGVMIGIGVLAYASTAAVTAAPVKGTNAKAQKLNRSRKLKRALRACDKDRARSKRKRCEAAARVKYGAKKHKTKKRHKTKVTGPGTTGTTGITTGTGTTGGTTGTGGGTTGTGGGTTGTGGGTTGTGGGTTGTGGATTGTTGTTGTIQEMLTVTVAQTSEGTVSGSGGISCPGTCSASYAYGTQVTLTANPDSGYVFSGWSGACSGTGSCVVTMDAAETVTASFGAAPFAAATPGSYSGSDTSSVGGDTGAVSFYVSPDASAIQDLRATTYELCTPSAAVFADKIQAASIPIESSGAFSYSGSSTGVFENSPATFDYSFSGKYGTGGFAGQLTETVSYGSGTTYSCTSDLQSWSAARESSQGTQTNAPAQAGSYSGSAEATNVGGDTGSVSFYVSPDASAIQDLRVTTYELCTPSAAVFADKIQAASIPIESSGAFSYSGSSTGVFDNTAATFKYTIAGHLHGLASSGEQRVAGQLTETVSYGSGTTYSCTSDLQSWSAARESSQGTQTNAPAQAGSYSGSAEATNVGGDTGSVKFSVSGGGTAIDNLEVSAYELCDPTAPTFLNTFTVASIPIESNGSFSYNGSTNGTYDSSAATFMLTFEGHLHGLNSSGNQRVAGQLTETVSYGSGTTYSCTSDLQSWTATD
jgi:Divergent InlB B-repeat domain